MEKCNLSQKNIVFLPEHSGCCGVSPSFSLTSGFPSSYLPNEMALFPASKVGFQMALQEN